MEKTEKPEMAKKNKLSSKTKKLIGGILAAVVFAGLCVLIFFIWDALTYLSTQNSKVLAATVSIVPSGAGRLTRWTAREGDTVTENEVIGRVENSSYLRSPVNGKVVKSNAVLNQWVSQTTVIGVIADTSNMYIQANIEETKIAKIREGQKVSVELDAFPRHSFEGFVEKIDMLTQDALGGTMNLSASGTFIKTTKFIPVKIRLNDNTDLSQILGTNAAIKIRPR
jgi:multidrug resistance efflux pump